jgi:hypothetical protein
MEYACTCSDLIFFRILRQISVTGPRLCFFDLACLRQNELSRFTKQVFGSSLYSFELTRSQRLQEATHELRFAKPARFTSLNSRDALR